MQTAVARLLLCVHILVTAVHLRLAGASTSASNSDDIDVQVRKDGSLVRVDIELTVDATREEAWGVLTDYDRMAAFVPMVESSVVTKREGNELEVAQKGRAVRGPLDFPFSNVRRVALTPMREIHSRIVSGDLAPAEVITTLDSADGKTRVTVKGVYAPKIWVPPVIGPAIIAAETREQWQVFRKEILHRRHN
jgi:carbon monoxide dehydrogenase subunit G